MNVRNDETRTRPGRHADHEHPQVTERYILRTLISAPVTMSYDELEEALGAGDQASRREFATVMDRLACLALVDIVSAGVRITLRGYEILETTSSIAA